MKAIIVIFIFISQSMALTEYQENKLQEEALVIAIDNGKDSPEGDDLDFSDETDLKLKKSQ